MTICNMSIEAGARAGMIAPDDTTFAYLEGRPGSPRGKAWEQALDDWRRLPSDADAAFDREVEVDAGSLAPQVTWGTNPAMVAPVDGPVPDPAAFADPADRAAANGRSPTWRSSPEPRSRISGSTGSSSAPARTPASRTSVPWPNRRRSPVIRRPGAGRSRVRGSESPGGGRGSRPRVRATPDSSGGEAGCSMCLGMNPDVLAPGERCASTSNRNFEGRQGRGGRTHLVSPATAAAAALDGATRGRPRGGSAA